MLEGLPPFADPRNLVPRPGPEPLCVPPDANALAFLQSVYRNASVPLSVRMKAAIEALPFESPKLEARLSLDGSDFASRLDAAVARSRAAKLEAASTLIETEPREASMVVDHGGPMSRLRRH